MEILKSEVSSKISDSKAIWKPEMGVETSVSLRKILLDLVLIVDPEIRGFKDETEVLIYNSLQNKKNWGYDDEFSLIHRRISELNDDTRIFLTSDTQSNINLNLNTRLDSVEQGKSLFSTVCTPNRVSLLSHITPQDSQIMSKKSFPEFHPLDNQGEYYNSNVLPNNSNMSRNKSSSVSNLRAVKEESPMAKTRRVHTEVDDMNA